MKNLARNEVVRNVQMKRENRPMAYADETKKTLAECLLMEMEENETLRNFFGALSNHISIVRNVSASNYEREARKIHEQVQKIAAKKAEIVARIRANGITLNENVLGPVYTMTGYGNGHEYQRYEFDYAYRFSGVEIKKEMLTNPNDTTFKDKYEKANAMVPERKAKIADLKRQLRKFRLLGRFTHPDGRSYKEELTRLKVDIEREELSIRAVDRYKRDYEFFNGLTTGERELILNYFKLKDLIAKGVDAINMFHKKAEAEKPPVYDKDVIEKALDRMQANGMIEEDMQRVFEIIDDVAQKRRLGFYDKKRSVSGKKDIANAFLTEFYGFDERAENAIIKAKEEQYFRF